MIKIKSPMFYNGNKYTLLDELKPLIPKNKDGVFYDVFGGSGTMSLNFTNSYKKVVYSEIQNYVYRMFKWSISIDESKLADLRAKVYALDDKYNCYMKSLSDKEIRANKQDITETPEYKGWLKYLENEKITMDSDADMLWISSTLAFSHTLKFTKDGYLGKSYGAKAILNSFFEDFLTANITGKNIECINRGFSEFPLEDVGESDFVYLDPPYFQTKGNYNKFWKWEDEMALFAFCEELNRRGIKWGMSNVFSNKDIVNEHLIEWCKKNGWVVHHFKKIYAVNGSSGDADEVFICNYDYNENGTPLSLFDDVF